MFVIFYSSLMHEAFCPYVNVRCQGFYLSLLHKNYAQGIMLILHVVCIASCATYVVCIAPCLLSFYTTF